MLWGTLSDMLFPKATIVEKEIFSPAMIDDGTKQNKHILTIHKVKFHFIDICISFFS